MATITPDINQFISSAQAVSMTPGLIVGTIVGCILLVIIIMVYNGSRAPVNVAGYQIDGNGEVVYGVDRMPVRPMNPIAVYLIAFGVSAVTGLIAGAILHNVLWCQSNPELCAAQQLASVQSSARGRQPLFNFDLRN